MRACVRRRCRAALQRATLEVGVRNLRRTGFTAGRRPFSPTFEISSLKNEKPDSIILG